ncbi:MAG: porin family protein [Capnocytophaga sp.]|nr:porin family protein [Capnocytophaga sp.]
MVALLFSANGYSQAEFGLKAGANLGKVDGVAYRDKYELGYQLGGFFNFNVLEKWAIQPEVLFNQTNTRLTDSYSELWDSKFDKGKKLNYVNVPVLLKYNPQGRISLLAGPQFGFLTNRDESIVQNSKKLFKNSDFSFVVGAELNLNPFFIYGRYVWGFSDISDLGGKATTEQLQIGVGVKLF